MNLQHLKYVVEIARTGSIRRSAENLYMAQPNLSSALKELEAELGIKLFTRSNKGVSITREGEAFLTYAKAIVKQMDHLSLLYQKPGEDLFSLRFACVRSSSMAAMMSEIIASIPSETTVQVQFMETSTPKVLQAVIKHEVDIGSIAFQRAHYPLIVDEVRSQGLAMETLWQINPYILVSKHSPLAQYDTVPRDALLGCTEVIYGDYDKREYPNIPASWTHPDLQRRSLITVYERSSMLDLLSNCPNCYMWVGATHADTLEKHGLMCMPCDTTMLAVVEALVYRRDTAKTEEMLLLMDWVKAVQYPESFRSQEPFSPELIV